MAHRAQTVPMGFNQATPAMQSVLRSALGGSMRSATRGSRSKKRRKATSTSRVRRKKSSIGSSARRATRKAARFVKGSAAAKRHMAKLRKMVKRKR